MPPVAIWWPGTTVVAAEFGSWLWVAALCIAAVATDVQACRCAPLSLAEYFERADVVMEAEIVAIETIADANAPPDRLARVRVLHDYKQANGVRGLRTPTRSEACGLELVPGARYWIFGRLAPGSAEVEAGNCGGSRLVEQPFRDTGAADVRAALQELASAAACPSPAPAEIAARIALVQTPRDGGLADSVPSPNGAYRFVIDNPKTVQRPPRRARLRVDRERDTLLQMTLHGVAADVSAQWVNGKLILARIQWSGTLRSDVLLDVERAAILSVDSAKLDDAGRVQRWLDEDCRRNP